VSNQQPGPTSRRRRIAGERRGATTTPEVTREATPTADGPGDTSPAPPSPGSGAAREAADSPGRVSLLKRRGSSASSAPVTTAPATSRPSRRGGRAAGGRGLVLGLAGLLVVLLTYTGLMLLGLLGTEGVADLDRTEAEASAGRAAQSSAERAAEAVLAYDFRSLEEDRDAATRFMTKEYAADYVGTFDTAVVEVATEAKAQVTVEVQGSAVMTAGVDRARILLFVDQATVSRDSAEPRLALNRVEFQMVKQGDSWVVDDILSF
jgi:Mce-associated membrane protein